MVRSSRAALAALFDGSGGTENPTPAPTGLGDVGLAAVLGGSLLVVVLLFGGIALFARRRPTT